MTIQILSPRLANQIAAGEVVERPSSVLKELLENSLDAGATQIDITIEKGGHKLVKLRDNGKGIPRDEIELSLARHATSKIQTIDDLGKISSLGFRGEALASVSSVSRLVLTSKPETQSEAWQVVAEGRDMIPKVSPASHPNGTTVVVQDLFFNTPARRRFLRTEKTEFTHIDELVKRIALSRFDVQFTLSHNGKQVRQYRKATTDAQKLKRVTQICGGQFGEHAARFDNAREGITMSGWLVPPHLCAKQNDKQFCYVNGRMIKDKLVNHAIRQSYGERLLEGLHPTYVIFLELAPEELDVNVHPTKHEVRFHQGRWMHDFVVYSLNETLSQIESPDLLAGSSIEALPEHTSFNDPSHHRYSPTRESHSRSPSDSYRAPSGINTGLDRPTMRENWHSPLISAPTSPLAQGKGESVHPSKRASASPFAVLSVYQQQYALLQHDEHYYWIDVFKVLPPFIKGEDVTPSKPVLIPKRLEMNEDYAVDLDLKFENLAKVGFKLSFTGENIIVQQVSVALNLPWIDFLIDCYLSREDVSEESQEEVLSWLTCLEHIGLCTGIVTDLLSPTLGSLSAPADWLAENASEIACPMP